MQVVRSETHDYRQHPVYQKFSPDALEPWRLVCDPLADDVITWLFPHNGTSPVATPGKNLLEACKLGMLRGVPACRRYWDATHHVPAWVDFKAHQAGQTMFFRHGFLTILVGLTVLIDSYAGRKDNKVLMMSGRLSRQIAFRRLVETAQYTLRCVTPKGLQTGQPGHQATLEVRLLHARVRQLCRLAHYRVDLYQEPINQEAMCGTLMLFSHGVIRALERLGANISAEEKESYHTLWRYVGYLMGVNPALLPDSYLGELALYHRAKEHQYIPDEDSRILFDHAVAALADHTPKLPVMLNLFGGQLLHSEVFLRNFAAHCIDEGFAHFLGLKQEKSWRLGFQLAGFGVGAATSVQAKLPLAAQLTARWQIRWIHDLMAALAEGKKVEFTNPGFASSTPS